LLTFRKWFDTSGKSRAKVHHHDNRKTCTEKSVAGFLFWNRRIGRRPHIDAASYNARRLGVASAPPSEPTITIQLAGMHDHTAESIKSLEGFRIAWIDEAQTLSGRSLALLRPTIRAEGSELWASWVPLGLAAHALLAEVH
jgi:hypothetical protein